MNEIEVIQHPQINGLSVFFDTIDYRTPHLHSEFELLLVVENSLVIACEQKQFVARPGSLIVFNPNQLHEFHMANESCTFLCVQISPKCFSFSYPALEQIAFEPLLISDYLSPEKIEEIQNEMYSLADAYFQRKPEYEIFCMGKIALLLHHLISSVPFRHITSNEVAEQNIRNARMQRLITFVDLNYMHKIRLSDFAETEDRSLSYLSHFIKDNLNQNFQDYVNSVRFNAACKLMKDNSLRLLDICMDTGFSDYRYFSETFRRRTGMTPEEYRKRMPTQPAEVKVHHSIHSLEKFYTREKSMELLSTYKK